MRTLGIKLQRYASLLSDAPILFNVQIVSSRRKLFSPFRRPASTNTQVNCFCRHFIQGKRKTLSQQKDNFKMERKTDILPGKWTWITDFINCSGWLIIRWHWVPSTSYPTMVANSQYGHQSSVNICPYILRIVSWVGTPPCNSLQKHCS